MSTFLITREDESIVHLNNSNQNKGNKNYRNPKIEGNERKHKKEDKQKKEVSPHLSVLEKFEVAGKRTGWVKRYTLCCYYDISNMEVHTYVKNKSE